MYGRYTGVFVHGINSAIVLSDLCFSAKPWRWLHFYIPLLLGIWYIVLWFLYLVFRLTVNRS